MHQACENVSTAMSVVENYANCEKRSKFQLPTSDKHQAQISLCGSFGPQLSTVAKDNKFGGHVSIKRINSNHMP